MLLFCVSCCFVICVVALCSGEISPVVLCWEISLVASGSPAPVPRHANRKFGLKLDNKRVWKIKSSISGDLLKRKDSKARRDVRLFSACPGGENLPFSFVMLEFVMFVSTAN